MVIDHPIPRPRITQVLVAANLAMFTAMAISTGGQSLWDPHPATIVAWGGNMPVLVWAGEWWRLCTAMFLHIGILHLAINMYALWVCGSAAELIYGPRAYLVLYLGAGLAGSAASLLGAHEAAWVSAGASGAIFGIMGGLLSTSLEHRSALPPALSSALLRWVTPFLIINLVIGASIRFIDQWAHGGGLVGGYLLAYGLNPGGPLLGAHPDWRDFRPVPLMLALAIIGGVTVYAVGARESRPAWHLYQGSQAFDRQAYDEAVAQLAKAVTLDPVNADYKTAYEQALVGRSQFRLNGAGGHDTATLAAVRQDLRLALGLDAREPAALFMDGLAAARQGKFAEAKSLLAQARQAALDRQRVDVEAEIQRTLDILQRVEQGDSSAHL